MFLLRMMFWLGVVILLIPTSPDSASTGVDANDPGVTVNGAIGAAAATVSDLAGFCDRNGAVCETGSAAFEVFAAKAENAARLAYRMVSGHPAERGTGQAAVPDARLRDASVDRTWRGPSTSTDTLRPQDLGPVWQGPNGADI